MELIKAEQLRQLVGAPVDTNFIVLQDDTDLYAIKSILNGKLEQAARDNYRNFYIRNFHMLNEESMDNLTEELNMALYDIQYRYHSFNGGEMDLEITW